MHRDSRFKTRIKVGVSVAGQPTLKARFMAPAQAVTGVVLEVVLEIVVGSAASGIVT
jgi:hypothetical protein